MTGDLTVTHPPPEAATLVLTISGRSSVSGYLSVGLGFPYASVFVQARFSYKQVEALIVGSNL